jgi:hypothetical protein
MHFVAPFSSRSLSFDSSVIYLPFVHTVWMGDLLCEIRCLVCPALIECPCVRKSMDGDFYTTLPDIPCIFAKLYKCRLYHIAQ